MPNRKLLSLALTTGAAALLVGASTTGAARIPRLPPNLPRAPTVTQYQATLDVAGYIDVKSELDDTRECTPGRDLTIEFGTSFETHGGRRTRITIVNGVLVSRMVGNPGGVSHKGELVAYRETNNCPPAKRAELEKPECNSGKGRFTAILGSDVSKFRDGSDDPDGLQALNFPVNIALSRRGGPSQTYSCGKFLDGGLRYQRTTEHVVSALEKSDDGLVIPLYADNWDFSRLKKGQWLRRNISLMGACDKVLVRNGGASGSAAKYLKKCTVRGRIYVAIRRL